MKRTTEATKGLGQGKYNGDTNNCIIFVSWFSSKRSSEYAKDIGAEFLGILKTNNKGFCK